MLHHALSPGLALLVLVAARLNGEGAPSGADAYARFEAVRLTLCERQNDETFIQDFLAILPRFMSFHVVEGDLLLTEEEVRQYIAYLSWSCRSWSPQVQLAALNSGLAADVIDGQLNVVNVVPGRDRTIRYRIEVELRTDTEAVRKAISSAMEVWEKACPTCGVHFEEVTGPGSGNDGFVVRTADTDAFLAAAFFPNARPDRRVLWITAALWRSRS